MKRMIKVMLVSALFFTFAAKATTETVSSVRVFRLELHTEVDGTETCFVVGVDGVKRPLVLVDPDEYSILTGRLESVWQSFHNTLEGRRKLHGKIERTEFSEANGMVTKTEIYADGYIYRNAAVPKREKRKVKPTKLEAKIAEKLKPSGMSDKQWEVRKALKRIKSGKKKTVTVEHDAVSGKDTVIPPSSAN